MPDAEVLRFPTPATGEYYRYPATQSIELRAGMTRFLTGREQRWPEGVERSTFDLTFTRVDVAEKEAIRNFFNGTRGNFDTTWDFEFEGYVYHFCRFVDSDFEATEEDWHQWTFRLQIKQTLGGRTM